MKNTNQLSVLCTVNIIDETTPVFIIKNRSSNTHPCSTVINTMPLPSNEYSRFNEDELNLLRNKDVFFIKSVDKSETIEKSELIDKLVDQLKPYCNVVKTINLFDFICANNIDLDEVTIDLFDALKASNLDETSFRNLLIYFCNFDLHDLQSTLESYAQSEVDSEEIYKLLHCHSIGLKNEKDV